jgi:hypothetical protein
MSSTAPNPRTLKKFIAIINAEYARDQIHKEILGNHKRENKLAAVTSLDIVSTLENQKIQPATNVQPGPNTVRV